MLEIEFGTDINNKDTDGDGFEDYYEKFILCTDPTKVDTDGNGVLDRDEDSDGDGIPNAKEVELGLNPAHEDSDGDQIMDGDEIKLGLNPLSPMTHSEIEDKDYIIEQNVNEWVLERINADSPYTLSVSMKAAGCANTVLIAYESDYEELWQNNGSMLGKSVSLDYPEFKLEEITLNFKIEEEIIKKTNVNFPHSEGLKGLKRYQIFHYDEEASSLYPVKTEFDEKNNTISTTMEEAGDYVIIDIDKWLYLSGIDFGEGSKAKINKTNVTIDSAVSAASIKKNKEKDITVEKDTLPANYDAIVKKQISKIGNKNVNQPKNNTKSAVNQASKPADIVFVIDTSTSMDNRISECRNELSKLIQNLYNRNISARVSIITFIGKNKPITIHQLDTQEIWGTNPSDAQNLVKKVKVSGGDYENHMDALNMALNLSFRKNAVKFAFLLTDEPMKESDNHLNLTTAKFAEKLKEKKIFTSVICTEKTKESFRPLFDKTDGIQVSIDSNYITYIELFIKTVLKDSLNYYIRIPNSLETIWLSAVPSKSSTIDTDKDGITDTNEINWSLIKEEKNTLILPTLREYWRAMSSRNPDYFSRLPEKERALFDTIVVLPILSNPANKDSDGDKYPDKMDPRCMKSDVHIVELTKKDYIPIKDTSSNNTVISYGGNQGWKFTALGESTMINNYGCGLIAAADNMLYLSRTKKSAKTVLTDFVKWNGDITIKQNSYKSYVLLINETMISVYRFLGAPSPFISNAFNHYYKSNNIRLTSKWGVKQKNILQATKSMLLRDIPVLMSIGPSDAKIGVQFKILKSEPYEYKDNQDVTGHYFTVTGIIKNDITKTTMLHISSWGKSYYMDYKEYEKYAAKYNIKLVESTNILQIKYK